jgi:hypothetical protein
MVAPDPNRKQESANGQRRRRKKAAADAMAKWNKERQRKRPARQKKPKSAKFENNETQFVAAMEILKKVLQSPEISERFDPHLRTNSRMVYTKGVTLWMLILQRLGRGLSLEETVSHILQFDRDLLPDNKRVREGTLSDNSSGYHTARKRLSLEDIHEFSSAVCDYLGKTSEPILGTQRVFILDGTTITFQPTPELKRAFPPATNQYGESVWPVALLMVAHEMQTGCALLPQIDPMYGPKRSSEAAQAARIVGRLPEKSIVMADAGFGIFSVAYHSTQAGHDILFRLTKSRFGALRKRGRLIDRGPSHESYALVWELSPKDRDSNPDLPDDSSMEVCLHDVTLNNGKHLYLVTTLEIDARSAAELYSRRYDVEFDIRDLKVTMDAENILCKSVEMVKKELLKSVVAFNLIMQFRRQAAKLANVKPRRLSFKGVWISFRDGLLLKEAATFAEWQELYAAALISASKRQLPNRNKPRSYDRKAHPRRPKTTKFVKNQNKKQKPETPPLELK